MMLNYSQIFRTLTVGLVLLASPSVAQDTTTGERLFQTIEVQGNQRFRDEDVLATAGLRPGNVYTRDDIVAAVEALQFTGEFKSVRIVSNDDVLTISVEEEPDYSGDLTFGLGYNTDAGVFGSVGLQLADILDNKNLGANLTVSKEVLRGDLNIYGDAFWPGTRPGGIRVDFADFDYDDTLFDFSTGKLSPYVTFGDAEAGFVGEFRLTGLWTDISSVESGASAIVQADAGNRFVFGTGIGLRWQDVDAKRWSAGVNLDYFAGDAQFVDASIGFSTETPFIGSTMFRSSGQIGVTKGLGGDTVTVADRQTLGGSSMRGFTRGGLTPVDFCAGCGAGGQDITSDLGGERYAVLQNDLIFSGLSDRLPVTPSLYFDIGSSWDVDTATAPSGVLFADRTWRTSYGLAVTAETPLGNFSASYAFETNAEFYDDTERFGLSFSTKF